MLELELNQMQFEVAINAFHDEALCKMEFLMGVEIELLRKFEVQVKIVHMQPSLIYYIRNMVSHIERIYSEVHPYFIDMKAVFIFDLFRKLHSVMLSSLNFLSQALLAQLDGMRAEVKNRVEPVKEVVMEVRKARCLEQINYQINMIENEEEKIATEMAKMSEGIFMHKNIIEKMRPSQAVTQLETLCCNSEEVVSKIEKIVDQACQIKLLEFKEQCTRPEDIAEQHCRDVHQVTQNLFKQGISNTLGKLTVIHQQARRRGLVDEGVQVEQKIIRSQRISKETALKNPQKVHSLLVRERQVNDKLTSDLQFFKRSMANTQDELANCKKQLAQQRKQHEETAEKFAIVSKLYEDKREQFLVLKSEVIEKQRVHQLWKEKELQRYMDRFKLESQETQTYINLNEQEAQTEESLTLIKRNINRLNRKADLESIRRSVMESSVTIKESEQLETEYEEENQERLQRMTANRQVKHSNFSPPAKLSASVGLQVQIQASHGDFLHSHPQQYRRQDKTAQEVLELSPSGHFKQQNVEAWKLMELFLGKKNAVIPNEIQIDQEEENILEESSQLDDGLTSLRQEQANRVKRRLEQKLKRRSVVRRGTIRQTTSPIIYQLPNIHFDESENILKRLNSSQRTSEINRIPATSQQHRNLTEFEKIDIHSHQTNRILHPLQNNKIKSSAVNLSSQRRSKSKEELFMGLLRVKNIDQLAISEKEQNKKQKTEF